MSQADSEGVARGRPRHFDPAQVLQAATRVFWARGYEGTSVNDLVAATGLNKPSLYAAFGDKEALYLAVVGHYSSSLEAHQRAKLEGEPDVWKALEGLLRESARALTDPKLPGGCLVVTGLADCGTPNLPKTAQDALAAALESTRRVVEARLERGRRERQIPASVELPALVESIATFKAGMAIRTKSGATRAILDRGIDAFVALWPRGA